MNANLISKKSIFSITCCNFILFYFIFFIDSNTAYSQKVISDTMVQWSPTPLKWPNFTILPDTANTGSLVAYTVTKFFYLKRNVRQHGKEFLDVKIINNFWKTKSWVKKSYMNDTILLKHEQGHFDISEIYARRLIKKLASVYLPPDYLKELIRISDDNYALIQQAHLNYDKATDHGSNRFMQEIWNRKIQEELEELIQYSKKQVLIRLKTKLP